jgi:hypothetical protein
MPDAPINYAGSDYVFGVNSYTLPTKLSDNQAVMAMNCLMRGGIPQTRPGTDTVLQLPRGGKLQGLKFFKPDGGVEHLVAAVDGKVYVSPYPFNTYTRLNGIEFSVLSEQIAWAVCLKSTDYDLEGKLYFLDRPYSVLIMQDGNTRAAYWDGSIARHLDPTPIDGEITQAGKDETPMGLWMAWSNNRLWVSRGNQVFASDIGNPLKFTDQEYINEGRAFYLPDVCTGIVETSDQQGIIAFTETTGTFIQSSIQDRTLWLSTPEFQKTILPKIGCVAPRSIVSQYGLIWWYSHKGLISLNDALRLNITSRLDVQDNEMFASKYNVSYKLSGICGAYYENILFQSLPNGDKYNTHTYVLDQAPFDANVNAWAGYWTGWRPVEWANGVVNGEERLFFASVDYDNNFRVWEAMLPSKLDNGLPITSWVQFKEHNFGNFDYKEFEYAELQFRELQGVVDVMVAVAGSKGAYQKIATKRIVATEGQVYADAEYGRNGNLIAGFRPQQREMRTQQGSQPSDCNEECVESEFRGLVDKAMSIMVTWSGIAGIVTHRVFTRPFTDELAGKCENNESQPRLLTEEGCGELAYFSEKEPFEEYTSTKTYARNNPSGQSVSYTTTATSKISQDDADRKASEAAQAYVLSLLGEY